MDNNTKEEVTEEESPTNIIGSHSVLVGRDMKNELQRLETYKGWPLESPSKETLANAGFFYTEKLDCVKCPFCNIYVANWEPYDIPLEEHEKHIPRCPFIMGYDVGNIPINADPIRQSSRYSRDVVGVYNRGKGKEKIKKDITNNFIRNTLKIILQNTIKYPLFSLLDLRKESFSIASEELQLFTKKKRLCEAGFFYSYGDNFLYCFHCGIEVAPIQGKLHKINVWQVHEKLNSLCSFYQANKRISVFSKKKSPKSIIKQPLLTPQEKESGQEKSFNDDQKCSLKSGFSSTKVPSESVQSFVGSDSSYKYHKCKICLEEDIKLVFAPCGHTACCLCGPSLHRCHICRDQINGFLRVYL